MTIRSGGNIIAGALTGTTDVIATGTTEARTLADRFADVLNVKDFGAVGDGITDDTAAIQAALDKASQIKTPLFMPSGVYIISDTLNVNNDTFIIGVYKKTEIKLDSANLHHHMMWHEISSTIETVDNIYISDIIFNGNADITGGGYGKAGLLFYGVKNLTVERCVFKNCTSYGMALQAFANSLISQAVQENVYIYDCVFDNNGYSGLADTFDGLDIKHVVNCVIDGCIATNNADKGIDVRGEQTVISNCVASGNIMGGISAGWGIADTDTSITDCFVTGSNYGVIVIESENVNSKTGRCIISNCIIDSRVGIQVTENVDTTTTDNLQLIISDCVLQNCASAGVNILHDKLDSCVISGISAKNCIKGISSVTTAVITNSSFNSCGNGIAISNSSISNCSFIGSTAHAINGTGNSIDSSIFSSNYGIVSSADNYIGPSCLLGENNTSDCGLVVKYGSGSTGATLVPIGKNENIDLQLASKGNSAITMNVNNTQLCKFKISNIYPSTTNTTALGSNANRWSQVYVAASAIELSDGRYKQNVVDIDESLMKAWGKVRFMTFQFKDAVEKKGNSARLHIGVIAQDVEAAFSSEGLNARNYGLLCYDEWEDELDENGNIIRPAGNVYSIRYSEALALECAYQRWKLEQIENKLKALTN